MAAKQRLLAFRDGDCQRDDDDDDDDVLGPKTNPYKTQLISRRSVSGLGRLT